MFFVRRINRNDIDAAHILGRDGIVPCSRVVIKLKDKGIEKIPGFAFLYVGPEMAMSNRRVENVLSQLSKLLSLQ
jgi:hypothetical protein